MCSIIYGCLSEQKEREKLFMKKRCVSHSRIIAEVVGYKKIKGKDYIKNPKPNGYRSFHLIIMVTVYFSDHKCNVPVEVQLRTIAMEFWASVEHQLRYKKKGKFTEKMQVQLKQCADAVTQADEQM